MPASFSTTGLKLFCKSPIKMSNVIRPKRQTFNDWLLQSSKTINKPQIKPLMSCTIEPPKNLIFNKEFVQVFQVAHQHAAEAADQERKQELFER